MTEGNTPTPGSEWRVGYVIRLPSGNSVRLRPVPLDMLILSGKVPDLLTPAAAKVIWDGPDVRGIAAREEIDREFIELVNIIVPAAMMEPRVVDSPQADDEISLDDIDFGDKVAIFQVASGGALALRAFRDQQARDMAAVLDSQDDGEPAQPVSEDPG